VRQRVHGAANGKHVALIGVWDPIVPAHGALFREAVDRAARSRRKVAVITLDPPPVAQLRGETAYPTFHDLPARLFLQEQCGVQTRVAVSMSRKEVDERGAAWLLSRLRELVPIAELSLGASQSLGRGEAGGGRAIREYCDSEGISLRALPLPPRPPPINEAREHLRNGRLRSAVSLLSHPLYWSRPAARDAYLPWPPGRYSVVPSRTPTPEPEPLSSPVVVELEAGRGSARLRWPDRGIPWLAFLSGPGDHAPMDVVSPPASA
jgi:FAD synthase